MNHVAIILWFSWIITIAQPQVYFGEDLNHSQPDNPERLLRTPNASRESAKFLSRLEGVETRAFEDFPANSSPTSLTFGEDVATLIGNHQVRSLPNKTFSGVYPTS